MVGAHASSAFSRLGQGRARDQSRPASEGACQSLPALEAHLSLTALEAHLSLPALEAHLSLPALEVHLSLSALTEDMRGFRTCGAPSITFLEDSPSRGGEPKAKVCCPIGLSRGGEAWTGEATRNDTTQEQNSNYLPSSYLYSRGRWRDGADSRATQKAIPPRWRQSRQGQGEGSMVAPRDGCLTPVILPLAETYDEAPVTRCMTIECEPSRLPQWQAQMNLPQMETASNFVQRCPSLQTERSLCGRRESKQPHMNSTAEAQCTVDDDGVEIFFFQDKPPQRQHPGPGEKAVSFLNQQEQKPHPFHGNQFRRATGSWHHGLRGAAYLEQVHPRPASSPSSLETHGAETSKQQRDKCEGTDRLKTKKVMPKSILVKSGNLHHARSLGRRVRFNKYVAQVVCS